jgi:hypothetical protein
VANRHDARRTVDRAAAKVVVDALHLAGVNAHPDGETDAGHLQLSTDGCVHRRFGRRERGGDAVAHRREHLTAHVVDRLAQDREVTIDEVAHVR